MSIQIIISGTVIDFPSSAQSPNWAPALIEFAQTVESALSGVVGTYDVPVQTIEINNAGIPTDIAALSFPTNLVRSATVQYAYLRKTSSALEHETGTLTVLSSEVGWSVQREFAGDTTPVENPAGTISSGLMFYINSTGQISYDASILAGTSYQGKLTFSAKALEVT